MSLLLDLGALRLGARHEVLVGERLGDVEDVLAAPAGDVEEDAAADDALLGDRQDARLGQATDRGLGVVAVPDLAVVPDVTEGVVLRRALEEQRHVVVGVVGATREVDALAGDVLALVDDHRAHGAAAAGPHRVALGVGHLHLQGEDLAAS